MVRKEAMNKLILSEVQGLGFTGIELLALVTNTSFDVVFYANVAGNFLQSNAMADQGLIDPVKLAAFYNRVATIIRSDANFDSTALNIVKVNRNNEVSVSTKERDSRVYAIKKEWRTAILKP